jgi:hypothetical protein
MGTSRQFFLFTANPIKLKGKFINLLNYNEKYV